MIFLSLIYFLFHYYFVMLIFKQEKKAHNNKFCSEGYFCEFSEKWFIETYWMNNCLDLCSRRWEKHLVFVLDKERNQFHCHICTLTIKYNFLVQTMIDVRRTMITGGGWMYFESDEGWFSKTTETILIMALLR